MTTGPNSIPFSDTNPSLHAAISLKMFVPLFGAEINLFHLVALRFGRDLKYRWTLKGESIDEWTLGFGFGPEWARVNVVRRGFPSFSRPRWVWMDVSVAY